MQLIDELRLETDLEYRFGYLTEFMGLDADDVAAIHGSAVHLADKVPGLVDAVYDKLFKYSSTKRHFVPRQSGYEGETPKDVESLAMSHEMIEFRKQHLGRYLVALVTRPYDGKMAGYLDMVGKMHTPQAGATALDVPLLQMNALLGFVSDALNATIFSLGLPRDAEMRAIRAFGKLLWVQNDLINRHYVGRSHAHEAAARAVARGAV
jgi:hypothetical protein